MTPVQTLPDSWFLSLRFFLSASMLQMTNKTTWLRAGGFCELGQTTLLVLCCVWLLIPANIQAQTPARTTPKGPLLTTSHARPTSATGAALFVLAESDRRSIEQLLAEGRAQTDAVARLKLISARLLGRPYLTHPLVGSPHQPEQLVARMDGFDCVTYIETVLALSNAVSMDDFLNRLRELRYVNGEVSYVARLHYSTDWYKTHIQRGLLQDVTQGDWTVECTKTLGAAVGLPARVEHIRYFPRARFAALTQVLRDGDLIFFVSGRAWLDTNHVGLVFREGDQVLLRHASRSHARVAEQPLAEFTRTNKMIGFIVARPLAFR
jgi:hypothetical protein